MRSRMDGNAGKRPKGRTAETRRRRNNESRGGYLPGFSRFRTLLPKLASPMPNTRHGSPRRSSMLPANGRTNAPLYHVPISHPPIDAVWRAPRCRTATAARPEVGALQASRTTEGTPHTTPPPIAISDQDRRELAVVPISITPPARTRSSRIRYQKTPVAIGGGRIDTPPRP
jgi:hypothetical protein